MRQIIREFYRANGVAPLRFATVTAVCAAAFLLTGSFSRENTRLLAMIVTRLLGAVTALSLVDLLIARIRFKKRLEILPENYRAEILSGFSSVPTIGKRWFFERSMLYFTRRRIEIVCYDELESADLKHGRLYLKLIGGKTLPLPFESSENPAMLVAALRSRNGKLRASIDGKPVDFDKSEKKKNGKGEK